jgi:hypothetical protein
MIYNMQTMVITDSGCELYIAIYQSEGALSKMVASERNAVQVLRIFWYKKSEELHKLTRLLSSRTNLVTLSSFKRPCFGLED